MDDRGIISSLFDLSFTHFIAPKLWRILYALFLVLAGLCGITVLFTMMGLVGKFGGFILGVPAGGLAFLLMAMYVRVIMEVLIVVFRGVDYLREINEKTGRM